MDLYFLKTIFGGLICRGGGGGGGGGGVVIVFTLGKN